jgi:hypothetical protein
MSIGFPNRKQGRVIPILLLVVFTAVPVAAQEIQTYRQVVTWLETNPGSPQFGSVLLEAVHLAPSLDDLRSVTSNHLASVSDSRQRARILFTVGRVQELAYRYSDARISYSRALESDPFLWDAAIRRGALALEAGDVSEAIILLSRVVNQAPTRSLQRQAAILRSRAFFLSGEVRRASLHLRGLTGYDAASASGSGTVVGEVTSQIEEEALLLLWEVASLMEDEPVRDWSAAALSARGSGVPEAVLLGSSGDDRTEFFPSPSQVLGGVSYTGVPTVEERSTRERSEAADAAQSDSSGAAGATRTSSTTDEIAPSENSAPTVAGIQTGSFRDPENASYMADDIRSMGFSAEIRTTESDGSTFYKVLVPLPTDSTPADAQETVVRLKERGVEGFLVFEE